MGTGPRSKEPGRLALATPSSRPNVVLTRPASAEFPEASNVSAVSSVNRTRTSGQKVFLVYS